MLSSRPTTAGLIFVVFKYTASTIYTKLILLYNIKIVDSSDWNIRVLKQVYEKKVRQGDLLRISICMHINAFRSERYKTNW